MKASIITIFPIITLLYFGLTHALRSDIKESHSKQNSNIDTSPISSVSKTEVGESYDQRRQRVHKESFKRAKESQNDHKITTAWNFFAYGPFHQLIKWESGDEQAMAYSKKKVHLCQVYDDTGEVLTCAGITFKYHPDWFFKILSKHGGFKDCMKDTSGGKISNIWCDGKPFLKNRKYYADLLSDILNRVPGIRREVSDFYWDHYAKKYFLKCSFQAALYIYDMAVLSGHTRAIKTLQSSHGIQVDGKFGPQTRSKCQEGVFDGDGFIGAEIARLETLRLCHKYCNGWKKRVRDKIKWSKKAQSLIEKNSKKIWRKNKN